MNKITTLGIDLAKSVFQLHGVDGTGKAVQPDFQDTHETIANDFQDTHETIAKSARKHR